MRTQTVGTFLASWVLGFLQTVSAAGPPPGSPAEEALRFFAALPGTTVESALASIRPAPVGAEEKRQILSNLPAEGELRPTPGEAAKLATLRRVLIYHKREEVFEVKLIDVPEARVVIHARSIVLISRPALRLVFDLELQAIVAHEIGHEYFWEEYERARAKHERRALRVLELRCDAIAVLTLLELGLDPAAVASAARRLTRFNEPAGPAADAGYPTVAEREQLMRALVEKYREQVSLSRRQ
jgi:predicted Zn-dependent protease